MNEQRIREIAEEASYHAENSVDYYSGIGADGLTWEAKILKARDLKFAELIVRECAKVCSEQRDPANLNYKPSEQFAEAVKQHFGVY